MAFEPDRVRLLCMMSLTFGFFIVEVVVSRITSSLAMLSDSFHMLSDVIALVVAFVAVRFAEKTQSTSKNTFGWIRAEVMGALVNAVFLTALCFTIILEAIERFTEPQEIENPLMVIWVGAGGLLVNLFGLCMFHGHSGGGHGHSHGGGHGHSHGNKKNKRNKICKSETPSGNGSSVEETNNLVGHCNSPKIINSDRPERHDTKSSCCVTPSLSRSDIDLLQENSLDSHINRNTHYDELDHTDESASQLNMRGVFLHVLGDALGSVIVVLNAIIFTFVWQPCVEGEPWPCWVLYLDPTLCIIMVCILLYTTYPLLKESALILLQTVPKQIDMQRLNEKLRSVEGILAVHELHIWQLAGSRIIATAHIKCHDPTSYMDVAKRIKDFFHNEGIHATTIQPEFVTVNSESRISLCELSCRTQCAPKLCCGNGDKPEIKATEKAMGLPISCLEVIVESPEDRGREQPPVEVEIQVGARSDGEVVQREVESSL
ncbi:ZNT1 protein, partial [Polyodon spathula]|nr:ZNT1 protein [Polyodon spathula]